MSESLRDKGLVNWTDAELAGELRFGRRFVGSTLSGMYEQILCEAVARLLERTTPSPPKKSRRNPVRIRP